MPTHSSHEVGSKGEPISFSSRSEEQFRFLLERLPAGAYICDADGLITYYNQHAVELWGRAPKLNDSVDRFCGSFKLYSTDGALIPHDQCWMALALKTGNNYNGREIVIERPDGQRRTVLAYASPMHDSSGTLLGAVNILIDITEHKQTERVFREREETFRRLVSVMPAAMYTCDEDGVITFFNPRAAEFWGRTPRLGDPDQKFCGSLRLYRGNRTVLPHDQTPMAKAIQEGTSVRNEEVIIERPDGSSIVASVNIDPLLDEAGRIIGAINIFVDITELKRAEEAVRRQARMLQLSHDAIFMWRLDGEIEYWNQGAEELYEFTAEEAIGCRTHELLRTRHPVPWEEIETALHEKGRWEGDIYHTSKSGTEYIVATRKQLVREADGGLLIFETNRDITKQKRYEEVLERAREEAEELARTKTALLANMSHEVRTPLASVQLFAEVISQRLGEKERQLAEKMKAGVKQLGEIIDAVLTLSRLEAGKVELKREVTDLVQEAERMADLLRPQAEQEGLRLMVEGHAPAYAVVDPAALGSALTNLIGNAIKFTEEGGVTIALAEETDERVGGAAVRVHVRDTGVGIDRAFLPHVFEEFRQETTGETRTHAGAGLGLAIAKRLVELMDGVIEVESERGVGTTFTLTFPSAGPVELEKASVTMPMERNGAQRRILLMDDDELIRTLVAEVLSEHYAVEAVATGREALARARSEPFDAVLLDIEMRDGMSGIEVLRALRDDAAQPDVPILAVTAYALPGDEVRLRKAGFDGYIAKPFEVEHILSTLDQLLAGA